MPIMQENESPDMIFKVMPKTKPGQRLVEPQPVKAAVAPIAPLPGSVPPVSPANAGIASTFPSSSGKSKTFRNVAIAVAVLAVLGVGITAFVMISKKNSEKKAEQERQEQIAAETERQRLLQEEIQRQNQNSLISNEWRSTYFGASLCENQANCGDDADPDMDGLSNYNEFSLNLDPNNPDSDADGLADGDEVNIFGYNPSSGYTTGNTQYPDTFQAKTKWNTTAKRQFNDVELKLIAGKIKEFGLHIPTTTSLEAGMVTFYTNYGGGAPVNTNLAPGALDRDTQRSDSIKQIGYALLKYADANQNKYPNTTDFAQMVNAIKPLLAGKAVNTTDPTNKTPYVYSYEAISAGSDFKLTYYSETQNQVVSQNSSSIKALQTKDLAINRDTQRKADLEQLSQALFLYSNDATQSTNPEERKFPTQQNWKTDLSPKYLAKIPVDPQTNTNYEYTVNADFTDFALQAVLESPPSGEVGYLCTSDGCGYY